MCERSWGWINYTTFTDLFVVCFAVRLQVKRELCGICLCLWTEQRAEFSSAPPITQKVPFHNEQQMGGVCRHHLWPITEWWRTFYHSRSVCTHYRTGNQCYTASRVWLFGVGQHKEVKRLIEYAVPLFQDLRRQQSLPVYSAVVLIVCGDIYSRTVLKCRFEVPELYLSG